MSRKEELLKMASLLRSQADGLSSRDAKQAFQKMADYYPKPNNYQAPLRKLSRRANTPNPVNRPHKSRMTAAGHRADIDHHNGQFLAPWALKGATIMIRYIRLD